MRSNKNHYIDGITGELNYTGLAEDTAGNFDLYEDDIDYKIPEIIFELAGEF